jgi:hypothetical protein
MESRCIVWPPAFGILGFSMWRTSRSTRLLTWIVLLTVLAVRAGDTHMHLCFDGQEPPITIHSADASVHNDEDHDGKGHSDQDVEPFVAVSAKCHHHDGDAAPPIHVAASVFVPPSDGQTAPATDPALPTDPPFHLRPPPRGPPA